MRDSLPLVEKLLEKTDHAQLNALDLDGDTALIMASITGKSQMVPQLIRQGADPNIQNKNGCTALFLAAAKGNLEIVNQLLELGKAEVDLAERTNDSPLLIACQEGYLEVARALIDHGADVNYQNNKGVTPLIRAVYGNHRDLTEYLLQQKAKINVSNMEKRAPIHLAAEKGYLEMVKLLVRHKADIELRNQKGWTPLILASYEDQQPVVKFLIEQNAKIDAVEDVMGDTALTLAAQQGSTQSLIELIKAGANKDYINNVGLTALERAERNDHYEIVSILKGSDQVGKHFPVTEYKLFSQKPSEEAFQAFKKVCQDSSSYLQLSSEEIERVIKICQGMTQGVLRLISLK
jgi:ankyrin repeat protein